METRASSQRVVKYDIDVQRNRDIVILARPRKYYIVLRGNWELRSQRYIPGIRVRTIWPRKGSLGINQIIKANLLKESHIDYLIFKTLKGLHFLHSKQVMHRDIKPSNLLVDQYCEVRIADFGLARTSNKIRQSILIEKLNESRGKISPKSSSPKNRIKQDQEVLNLTDYVASRWYRPPEVLLGSIDYTCSMDIWSLGCILGKMR